MSRGKWRSLSHDDKEDDGSSEDVHLLSIVLQSLVDLWSHIRNGSKLGLKHTASVSAFNWRGKSKVCNLHVVVFVEHDILGLEIAMDEFLVVAVLEPAHHLSEEVSSLGLAESTSEGHKVEELSALGEFEDDVLDILSSFLGVALDSFIDLEQFDDVLVVEGLQGIDLGLDKLVKLRVLLQNLDGISGVGVVLGELDLAGDSTTEFPTQSVLS